MTGTQAETIVLVHGGFVDGSGWESVYDILRKDGYDARPEAEAVYGAIDIALGQTGRADRAGLRQVKQ
jgi:hypothetical protein